MTENQKEDTSLRGRSAKFRKNLAWGLGVWIITFVGIIIAFPSLMSGLTAVAEVHRALGISQKPLLQYAVLASLASLIVIMVLRPQILGLRTEESAYSKAPSSEMMHPSEEETKKALAAIAVRVARLEDRDGNVLSMSDDDLQGMRVDVLKEASEALSAQVASDLRASAHRTAVLDLEARSVRRLADQSVVLGSRANLTLMMGVLFCTLGLFALWFSFFISAPRTQTANSSGWIDLFQNYAPRFALVLVVEVIGFFFLRLYKATLSEIRYIQNELTNVEIWLIALHSANQLDTTVQGESIRSLMNTERNSIIDKGQTTVEIERERASFDAERSALETAVALLHGNEKGSFWRRGG